MSTPSFKAFTANGEYVAAIRYPEDAAAFVGYLGDGATIRFEHKLVVWREGAEAFSASESYDDAAHTMRLRVSARVVQAQARRRAAQDAFAEGRA